MDQLYHLVLAIAIAANGGTSLVHHICVSSNPISYIPNVETKIMHTLLVLLRSM
jgi:hypothetical protein